MTYIVWRAVPFFDDSTSEKQCIIVLKIESLSNVLYNAFNNSKLSPTDLLFNQWQKEKLIYSLQKQKQKFNMSAKWKNKKNPLAGK